MKKVLAPFPLDLSDVALQGAAGWLRLQWILLWRTLLGLLGLTAFTGLVLLAVARPMAETAMASLVLAGLLGALLRWPSSRRAVAWGLIFSGLGFLSSGVWTGRPVALAILASLPGLAIFLDGLVLGGLATLCSAALFVGLFVTRGTDSGLLENLVPSAGVGGFMTVASVGWTLGRQRARRLLGEAHRVLQEEGQHRQRLTQAIFSEALASQGHLEQAVKVPGSVDWAAIERLVSLEVERAENSRQLRRNFAEPVVDRPQGADFSAAVLRSLLVLQGVLSFATIYYLGVLGHGPVLTGPVMLAFSAAGLWSLRGRAQAPVWMGWVMLVGGVFVVGADQYRDWGVRLTPTLAAGTANILNAVLLVGWRPALGVLVQATALALAAALALPAGSDVTVELSGILFSYALLGLIGLQAVVWQTAVLSRLEQERQRLVQGLARRRRLLGTLFHDIANPMSALGMIASLAREGVTGPEDVERCQRLVARLGQLLHESRAWLMNEEEAPPLQRVALDPLVEALGDLFAQRLQAKGIALRPSLPAGSAVLAQASALRDSLLGNLLSNAIKFSPPGGSIEIEAVRRGDQVCIEVRDQGPGLSLELRRRLKKGLDLPSLAGTAGELGQGLGLGLAQEHALRMGGSLDFLERQGGGLVAQLRLAAA